MLRAPGLRALIVLVAATTVAAACRGDAPPLGNPSPPPTATAERRVAPTARTPAPGRPSPSARPSAPPDHEAAFRDAPSLAQALVTAEQRIRDPKTGPEARSAWAHLQQAAYRRLADTPAWREEARARVPATLRRTFDRNLSATAALRRLTTPGEELPAWRIVAPPPADELLDHYHAAARAFGIDWTYLAAIHLIETRMGRIRGDSTAGARGPMQFLPSTWEAYGEGDIENPRDAILAAARYLAAHGAPEDMAGALWAYNHADDYVTAVRNHAAVIRDDRRAYDAYHQWQVYYRLTPGDVVLEEGWDNTD